MKIYNLIFVAVAIFTAIFTTSSPAQNWQVTNQTAGINYANCFLTDSSAYHGSWNGQFEYQGTSTADTVWFTKHYRTFKFPSSGINVWERAVSAGNWQGRYTVQLQHGDTVVQSSQVDRVYTGDFLYTAGFFTWSNVLDSVDAIIIKAYYASGYGNNMTLQQMRLDYLTVDGQLLDDFGDGATISGNVFIDLDSSGIREENEPGLSNWLIKAHLVDNPAYYDSTLTDQNGNFTITGLQNYWEYLEYLSGSSVIP